MSRHRNIRKINIQQELEEDDDDFEEEEDQQMSPETSKFIYQRPGLSSDPQDQKPREQFQQRDSADDDREWDIDYAKEEDDTMFHMDQVIVQATKKPTSAGRAGGKSTTQQTISPNKKQQPPAKIKPGVPIPPAVENLKINETAKLRSSSKSPGRTTVNKTQNNMELAMNAVPKYSQRSRKAGASQAINLVIIGHVDAGKSTLVGHLLYLLGNVEERVLHKFKQESSRLGKSSFAFAWILDESEEERTRGVTMDIARTNIETANGRKFNIIDAPGHKDFIPNMISGASQADAALLVINATRGEFETGFDLGGQTREHALLVRALGVSRLIVAVNKLDTVEWSRERFDELCAILSAFLTRRAGFESVQFIPVSGLQGTNLINRPSPADCPQLLSWYSNGQSLLQAMEGIPLPSRPEQQPLRIVVHDVLRFTPTALVLSAKVESGHVETGDRLFLMPDASPVTVKVVSSDELPSSAGGTPTKAQQNEQGPVCFAGDHATLTLAGSFEPDTVYPGHLLCRGGNELLLPSRHFLARIVTFDIRMPILKGTRAELFVHSLRVPCVIAHLRTIHPGSKELEKRNPRLLPRNVPARVDIKTDSPINIEPFARNKALGRVALRANGETIAAGIVEKCL